MDNNQQNQPGQQPPANQTQNNQQEQELPHDQNQVEVKHEMNEDTPMINNQDLNNPGGKVLPANQVVKKKDTIKSTKVPYDVFFNLNFFDDDGTDKELRERARVNCQYLKHEQSFSFFDFLESTFYHFVQGMILGPLTLLLGIFYWPLFRYLLNLRLLPTSLMTLIPIILWAIQLLIYIFFLFMDREAFASIDVTFIFLYSVTNFARSAMIGAKHGNLSRRMMKMFKGVKVDSKTSGNFELGNWNSQDPAKIEEHIEISLLRKSIDRSTFLMSFINKPSDFARKMLDDVKDLGTSLGSINCIIDNHGTEVYYYDGRQVFYVLLNYYNKHHKINGALYMFTHALIALLFALTIPFARLYAGQSWSGEYWLSIVIFHIGLIPNFFYMFAFFRVLGVLLNAYNRVDFILEQVGNLLSPFKTENAEKKLLPTINLADAVSLQSWIELRKLTTDYGTLYISRARTIKNCVIGVIFVTFGVAHFLNKVNFRQPFLYIEKEWFILTISYALFGYLLMWLLLLEAKINENVFQHKTIIRNNEQIYQSFNHFQDYYIESKDDVVPYDLTKIFVHKQSESIVHKEIAHELRKLIGETSNECGKYVQKLVDMHAEFIKEVEKDKVFNGYTLFGFFVTYSTATFVALIMIFAALWSYGEFYPTIDLNPF